MIKKKIGRRKIDDPERTSQSKRAKNGGISVIKRGKALCPCGSKKAFGKSSGIYCTRCGRKVK